MSIDQLLIPNVWTDIKPNSVTTNIIVNKGPLLVTCDDLTTIDYTPLTQGVTGSVLTRTEGIHVAFLPLPGSGGIVTNPLNSNLNCGVFDIVGSPSIDDVTYRCQNMNDTIPGVETNFSGDIIANDKIICSGANISGVLVALNAPTNIQGLAKHLTDSEFYGQLDMKTNTITNVSTLFVENIFNPLESSQIVLNTGGIDFTSDALNFNSKPIISTPYGAQIETTSYKVTGGLSTGFLKADGSIDSTQYTAVSGLVNNSVPYINTSGAISSNISNLYVQLNNNTIQSAINSIQTGVGYSIQLSANAYSETLTLNKQNYILAGTDSPLFAPTSQNTGNVLIGSSTAGQVSTRIKIKDIKFIGNLEFISSTYNELRSNLSNCEITGTLTFPAISGGGITWIYFFDCSINGPIIIPNQNTYGIVFTRCNFAGQAITNGLLIANTANLIYRDCTGLLTLSLGNCILYGDNAQSNGISQTTSYQLSLSGGNTTSLLKSNGTALTGTSAQFVMANASLNSTIYVANPYGLLNGITKFIKTSVTAYTLTSTLVPIIPNFKGLLSFSAMEPIAGDLYTITSSGQYIVTVLNNAPAFSVNIWGVELDNFSNGFYAGALGTYNYTYIMRFYFSTAGAISAGNINIIRESSLYGALPNTTYMYSSPSSLPVINMTNSSLITIQARASVGTSTCVLVPYEFYMTRT